MRFACLAVLRMFGWLALLARSDRAGERHLRLVPGQYAVHHHRHSPHRGRALRPPDWDDGTQAIGVAAAAAIRRHTVIGGLNSQYQRAA